MPLAAKPMPAPSSTIWLTAWRDLASVLRERDVPTWLPPNPQLGRAASPPRQNLSLVPLAHLLAQPCNPLLLGNSLRLKEFHDLPTPLAERDTGGKVGKQRSPSSEPFLAFVDNAVACRSVENLKQPHAKGKRFG